jgi:hypothetical protein
VLAESRAESIDSLDELRGIYNRDAADKKIAVDTFFATRFGSKP